MNDSGLRTSFGESLPRALREVVESAEGGEATLLDNLARRRVLAQLARERLRTGKTQAEIAKAIDRPASDISRFERGDTDPRLSKVVRVADALGGHLAFVLGRRTTISELADLDEEWETAETAIGTAEPMQGQALCVVLRGAISENTRRMAEAVAEAVVALARPLGDSVELEAIFPLEIGDIPWEPTPLERAIAEAHSDGEAGEVHNRLAHTEVLALGKPAGMVSEDGMTGTESELLHFTIGEEGRDIVVLPVFTRPRYMREPLVRNPDWQKFMVLQINGGSLLANVDANVHIVIDPWSELEFQLPPRIGSEPAARPPALADVASDIENPVTVGSSSRSLQPAAELVAAL